MKLLTRTKSFPAPEAFVNEMGTFIGSSRARISQSCNQCFMQKRPPGHREGVVHVEMAGVEPASEERTIEITTYIVSLLCFAPPQPTDRSLAK